MNIKTFPSAYANYNFKSVSNKAFSPITDNHLSGKTLPRQYPLQFSSSQRECFTEQTTKPNPNYASIVYSSFSSRSEADVHLRRVLDHFLKKDDTILEIGCNRGNNLFPLSQKYKVYGLDLDEHLVDEINRIAQAEGLQDRVEAAQVDLLGHKPLPPSLKALKGKCKAIYSIHTISHFSDEGLKQVVQKLKNYLAPGGIIVITVIDPEPRTRQIAEHPEILKLMGKMISPPSLSGGLKAHEQSIISRAFKDFRLITEYSRPFEPGELKHWRLPEKRLRWIVYQLPKSKPRQLQASFKRLYQQS